MISNQGRGSEFTLTVKGARSERGKTLDNLEDILDLDDMPERVVDNALPTPSPEQTIPQQKTAITHAPQMPKTTPKETSDNLRGLNVLIVEDVAAKFSSRNPLSQPSLSSRLGSVLTRKSQMISKPHMRPKLGRAF